MTHIDPGKAYSKGRIVLGDGGVLAVKLFFVCCACLALYPQFQLVKAAYLGVLLKVSDLGLDIVRIGRVDFIPWSSVAKVEISYFKPVGGPKMVSKLRIMSADGFSQAAVSLYGSGASVRSLCDVVTEFDSSVKFSSRNASLFSTAASFQRHL